MPSSVTRERLTDWFQWFRVWRSPLRKFLGGRWSLSASDLDDVAQEVFLRLLRYDNAELIEHPQAYLFKMAENVAGEWAMRARHRHPHDARWLTDLHALSQPEQEVAREAAQGDLQAALERLPPRQREVLRLHFGEELARAEIAEQLKVSERVVKRDLIRAYAKLRNDLDAEIAETFLSEGSELHERP
jgi:RNA polymerase sigma factor (sigma-70 family)